MADLFPEGAPFFPATRAHGLQKLRAFRPVMGRRYAAGRNYDHGPERRDAVSSLSPFIRRRLVTEEETVAAALAAHGPEAAEKFIQEVVWRGYFKGWLERRPSVWSAYRAGLERDAAALEQDPALRQRVAAAEAGETGLDCCDAWARELVETGYLHNHARMWFASIWIFTLALPWRLGADFFLRHLLDGDPASNTLGWRWVAGLHTRGKVYEAKAWNIAKFTGQRFQPREADFAAAAQPRDGEEPEGLPPTRPIRAAREPDPAAPTALLITEEDCRLEDFAAGAPGDFGLDIRALATLSGTGLRSARPVSAAVAAFEADALSDAASRLGGAATRLGASAAESGEALAAWAAGAGARQIVTPYVTVGPLRDWLDAAEPALAAQGLRLCEWRRAWDDAIWPHATAGFFKVKAKIPRILETVRAA